MANLANAAAAAKARSARLEAWAPDAHDADFYDRLAGGIEYRYNLQLDLTDFYGRFADDPQLRPAIVRCRGMRPAHGGSLYEYLVIAIVLQSATVRRTMQMMQALLERYGTPLTYDGKKLYEGMRPGARLEGLPPTLKGVERYPVSNATPDQPSVWTTVEFEFPEGEAQRVADALADVLDEHGGWYTNFTVDGETFVIYAHRIFRYPAGDEAGRAEAQAYGRTVGVPDRQLDWDE